MSAEVTKHKVSIILVSLDGNDLPLISVFNRSAKNGDNWYDLVGGKRDPKPDGTLETVFEAGIREVREEVGVELTDDDIIGYFPSDFVHPKTPTTATQFLLAVCPSEQMPHNKDPKENGVLVGLDPSIARKLLAGRVPQEVLSCIFAIK